MTPPPESFVCVVAPVLSGCTAAEINPAVPTSGTTAVGEATPRSQSEATTVKGPGIMVERHYRSLLKAISWRATGSLDTIFVSFLVTGRIKLAVSIGLVELFTKIGLFYVHERVWNQISLGRIKGQEDYSI